MPITREHRGLGEVCCGFRDTEKDKVWLVLSMLRSWGAEEQFEQRWEYKRHEAESISPSKVFTMEILRNISTRLAKEIETKF